MIFPRSGHRPVPLRPEGARIAEQPWYPRPAARVVRWLGSRAERELTTAGHAGPDNCEFTRVFARRGQFGYLPG